MADLQVPVQNIQASATSQADVQSMAPHRLFRPRSELRLNRALENLSMSTEEKVLKMNYGQNYDLQLQSISRQLSQRDNQRRARNRIYSAQKTQPKASLIPPHLYLAKTQVRPAKQQLKTHTSSTLLTSLDPYSLREGLHTAFGEKDPFGYVGQP